MEEEILEIWPLHHFDPRSHFNMTVNSSRVRETPWGAQNQTRRLIQNLQLAQVQSLRTMHLTLGAFSLALALLTLHRIIWDARRTSPGITKPRKSFFSIFHRIFNFINGVHPAETFPLILVSGSAIQQIIFVAVQSTSLNTVLSSNCRGLAMISYPALFIIGYLTLVFGVEMTIRAFKRQRFAQRGKWNVTICVGTASFLVFLTWLPTVIWPMFNRCFGSLIWFGVRYERISLAILSILIFFSLLLAALISIQLMRTSNVDPNERIAASRMCYYLLIAALLYTLIMPVEVQAHRRDFMNTLATSRVAEVALFSSGILIAFVHLFLRVNASRMVIKPVGTEMPTKQKRPRIRFFGPSDLEMTISGPLALTRPESREELMDEKRPFELDGDEKNHYRAELQASQNPLTPDSVASRGLVDSSRWPLPPDPEQGQETGNHKRTKSGYSLFPTRAEDVPRLPATVYSPPKSGGNHLNVSSLAARRQSRRSSIADAKSVTDVNEAYKWLPAPVPLFTGRHGRQESTDSSATVQIGLRFSVAPAAIAAAKCTAINRQLSPPPDMPPPPTMPSLRRDMSDSSGESLGLPIQSPSSHSSSSGLGDLSAVAFPQPPSTNTTMSPSKSGPGKTSAFPVITPQNSGTYLQTARDKVLPPTPRSARPAAGPGPPPSSAAPSLPRTAVLSGLRMNPVSPSGSPRARSPQTQSPTAPSPGARIPMGAGTMARSPPGDGGWI
jgi:hypothetical protein